MKNVLVIALDQRTHPAIIDLVTKDPDTNHSVLIREGASGSNFPQGVPLLQITRVHRKSARFTRLAYLRRFREMRFEEIYLATLAGANIGIRYFLLAFLLRGFMRKLVFCANNKIIGKEDLTVKTVLVRSVNQSCLLISRRIIKAVLVIALAFLLTASFIDRAIKKTLKRTPSWYR